MTPTRYARLCTALGMSVVGSGHFFDVHPRTARRWASGELPIPSAVVIVLELMAFYGVAPPLARKLAKLNKVTSYDIRQDAND